MSRLEFNPVEALEAISRSGFYHTDQNTDMAVLKKFCQDHGLTIMDGAEFTVTLVPGGTRYGGRSPEEWERIRKEAADKRLRNATTKKKKLSQ